MIEVSVRELRANLATYLKRLEAGESVTVKRRGKTIAVMSPVGDTLGLQAKVERLAARGLVRPPLEKLRLPKRRIRLEGEGPTVSEMVLEDRR